MPPADTPPVSNLDVERYRAGFRQMCRIRAFEEQAIAAAQEKLVLGAIHPSIGQEAVAVGVCGNLRKSDIILSTHRGHGHTMAKGAEALPMMRELFGRDGGYCQGKGGSMHIADFSVGMLGANGVVGANINIAAGAAHAIRLKGEDGVVVCFFGDGAINRGPFLEGLNWAGVFQLPILFVCEDNGFAATTRTSAMTSGAGPAARAEAIGIPASTVEGNDLQAVDEAARELVDLVRGGGPRFLVARTYRLTGHTSSDAAGYRPQAEVQERWLNDPIENCRKLLEAAGVPAAELAAIREAAEAEMRAAKDEAAATGWPAVELAYADVQDVGDPRTRAF
ncbi:pyruvate dehydrogenase E1 component alpha subunit [Tistlia consotensis]|uniref:Pyruvate dehydrogenase E1 component alpha subunit n=1 Tax=Tistlia consotensis USBA 355 TaxID=560819 RepID=A0A1Y6B8I6_9PROT|nr:thiamine pyrophosphate-dependent dehydrogenase E1 component subunit alpha [Tistlia consotensis]SME89935.1 pyruvate dehydrogenase E1 component alpha subunit [Tistlia consotensis USBA 355]SNR26455.1 pyruvate dehydrogenase E1 component alpha subunit [Tistlia consotensis]